MDETPAPAPDKSEIRRQMRERRQAVTPEVRRAAGEAVCTRLLGKEVGLLLRAWRVCVYLSTRHEIPTRHIVRALWEAGREVCVPAWSRSEGAYKLVAFDPGMPLIKGHHGIREPAVRVPVLAWDVDAFILPGLAFDAQGGRLGFGAGHYDHILSKSAKRAPKIAVCYDWQIVAGLLPQEPHDIAMDWVVSDARALHCAASRAQSKSPLQPLPEARRLT